MHSQPFELSGRAGQAWLLPVVGLAAAAASAFVYAWVNVYSPIAGYVSILFVALLAAGTALPVAFAGRWLKVRSTLQLRIAGAVTGAAAVYFAWAFFVWVMTIKVGADDAPSPWDWIQHPAALWEVAGSIAEDGWYTIGHSLTPKGIVLWLLWALEAAIVIGVGFMLAPSRIGGRGFCEDCTCWMQDEPPLRVPGGEGAPARAVAKGGLPALTGFEPPSTRGSRWLQLVRQRCPRCQQRAVYGVDDVLVVKTEKGRKLQARPLVPLSWQGEAEAAELQRIEQLLAVADAARFAALKQKPVADAAPEAAAKPAEPV